MRKTPHALLLGLITIFLLGNVVEVARMQGAETCYASFDDFAYRAPLIDREYMQQELLPSWEIASALPLSDQPVVGQYEHPLATRVVEGQTEVWIRAFSSFTTPEPSDHFLVYKVETEQWETVTAQVGDTAVFVEKLFVMQDGSLWGKTNWDPKQEYTTLVNVPTLAVFDNTARRFNFASGVLAIPTRSELYNSNPVPIVLDEAGIFWIFSFDETLYRYSPAAQSTEAVINLESLPSSDKPAYPFVVDAALGRDGNIFFETFESPLSSPPYRLRQNMLYQFVPETTSLHALDLPDESWPIFNGLLVDQNNRLWLGSIGYRDADGNWTLVHPETSSFFQLVDGGGFSYLWAPATLFYQSSDGRLWYTRFLDTGGWAEGTAWFNPQTGQGCLVTNQYATVVEDASIRLWLVAGGNLYVQRIES